MLVKYHTEQLVSQIIASTESRQNVKNYMAILEIPKEVFLEDKTDWLLELPKRMASAAWRTLEREIYRPLVKHDGRLPVDLERTSMIIPYHNHGDEEILPEVEEGELIPRGLVKVPPTIRGGYIMIPKIFPYGSYFKLQVSYYNGETKPILTIYDDTLIGGKWFDTDKWEMKIKMQFGVERLNSEDPMLGNR